jgi:hypothetical protein
MTQPTSVASLLDVDDTLLDNEGIVATLKRHLTRAFATERASRYYLRPIRSESPEPHEKLREEGNDERDPHAPRNGPEPLA